VRIEDALKHIHKYEMKSRRPTLESIAGAVNVTVNQATDILDEMESLGLVEMTGDGFYLTPKGREYALRVIRAHRLWEKHLADKTGFSQAEWHSQAEVQEHLLSEIETEALYTQLGKPTHDPHGDPIPTEEGDYLPHGGVPLSTFPEDTLARIVHIEDEPETVYAQLVAEELHPGMEVRVVESTPRRVRFWADGDEHLLAPLLAANISVVSIDGDPGEEEISLNRRLSSLKPGQTAEVTRLSPGLRGMERRRLMDLGILPGTTISAEFSNPNGDPVAYRVRGALIALRSDQADLIHITRPEVTT
jgi:DtxR family Mn-dependent transcriptional regulator